MAERCPWLAPAPASSRAAPKSSRGMKILSRSPFHSLVEGEGEEPFCELLDDIRRSKPLAKRYAALAAPRPLQLPNPYLVGALPFEADRPVHLETMRGCPMHCGYCYYGKSLREVAALPPRAGLRGRRGRGQGGRARALPHGPLLPGERGPLEPPRRPRQGQLRGHVPARRDPARVRHRGDRPTLRGRRPRLRRGGAARASTPRPSRPSAGPGTGRPSSAAPRSSPRTASS